MIFAVKSVVQKLYPVYRKNLWRYWR